MGLNLKELGKKVADNIAGPAYVNVVFKFKVGLAEKYILKDPMKVRADGSDVAVVNPESSATVQLKEGSHLIRLWMGTSGEKGVVDSTINLTKGSNYEVTYEYSITGNSGRISVRTI